MTDLGALLAQAQQTRDAKRRKIEVLFQKSEAIRKEMEALSEELVKLDEDIDQMELEQQQEQQQQVATKAFKTEPVVSSSFTMIEEEIPIPQTATQAPPADEILTELTPLTMNAFSPAVKETSNNNAAATKQNRNDNERPVSRKSGIPPLEIRAIEIAKKIGTDPIGKAGQKRPRNPQGDESLQAMSQLPPASQQQPKAKRLNSEPAPSSVASAVIPCISPWTGLLEELMQTTFRIPSYREHQREIMDATLQGENVFVLMRTGGGKSLTYQLPALYEGRMTDQKKVTVVISPLLSLIQDQEEQMNALVPGSALSFTSGLQGGTTEHARRWALVRDPDAGVCLVFVTPEKVHKSSKLRTELQKLHDQGRLGRFVVDEAHCACQWGCDFRPDYAQLGILKRHFPTIPVLAVTATASERVRQDVCQILGIAHNYQFFRSTANRPNLTYSIRPKYDVDVLQDISAWIQEHYPNESGIIYTLSRKDANTVAQALNDEYGIRSKAYHSDVSPKQKEMIHRGWMAGNIQVVVATIAFGLGINKPNVRFVIHHCISKTLEAYYQESGRAGRDGEPAQCVLYYSPRDVVRMRTLVHESHRGEENLIPMIRYAQACGNDAVCKAIMMDNLGEPNSPNPVEVQKENEAVTTDTRDVGIHGQIVARLVHDADKDITLSMLVTQWRSKTAPQYVLDNPPSKHNLTVDECERIVIALLVENILCFHMHWTAYTGVAYIRLAPRGHQLLRSPNPKILLRLPKRDADKARRTSSTKRSKKSAPVGDWLETKPKAKRKASVSKAGPKKRSRKSGLSKNAAKKKQSKKASLSSRASNCTAETEIIEVFSDEEESDDDEPLASKSRSVEESLWRDEEEDEEEYEFEG